MRVKFKKGITPKDIADIFLRIIEDRGNVIGSVNIYFQEYDENMKSINFDDYINYLEVTPSDISQQRYAEYQAGMRRSKLKAV